MNLQKARETLDDLALTGTVHLDQDDVDALHIGIEALDRLQKERRHLENAFTGLLPGETEE